MAASLSCSLQSCSLKSGFLGERSELSCIRSPPITRIGFFRKNVECKESRIGKHPIEVPSNVTFTLEGQNVKVKGPLGELSRTYPREVKVERLESGLVKVSKALETRRANQMHGLFSGKVQSVYGKPQQDPLGSCLDGIKVVFSLQEFPNVLIIGIPQDVHNAISAGAFGATEVAKVSSQTSTRTLTDNMIVGVSKGFEKRLQLIGVGYRALLEGKTLVLNLGFSHPVRMAIPEGIQVKVEDNTRIAVSGNDKCAVGDFCASVRKWRPPEPYKGKGIKYADEIIRRKEGKAGKKK